MSHPWAWVVKNEFEEVEKELKISGAVQHNNLFHLSAILETLAKNHAQYLCNDKTTKKSSEYNLNNFADSVISLDLLHDLDKKQVQETIDQLQTLVNELLESNLIIKCLGMPNKDSVHVDEHTFNCEISEASTDKFMPPLYDALLFIFFYSNEKFRQWHFKDLIHIYVKALKEYLTDTNADLAKTVSKSYINNQIRFWLPVVKLEIAHHFSLSGEEEEKREIGLNIYRYLKCSLLNQEDIYETVRTYLDSNDHWNNLEFELVDYTLIPLNEKNGHLGEYFHLTINLKVSNKNLVIKLFVKYLKTAMDLEPMSKKEEFFYQTILPKFSEIGLDPSTYAPKCYLSRLGWVLVLDDLFEKGFIGPKPNTLLSYETLKMALFNLAKFHSSTIILEEKLSKAEEKEVRLNEVYKNKFKENGLVYEEGARNRKFYDKVEEVVLSIVEKFPDDIQNLANGLSVEDVRSKVKKAYVSVFEKYRASSSFPNTICHGDMYVANTMIKCNEQNMVSDMLLIDFQLIRYAPPAGEVLFFLYMSSSKETRDKYMDKLLEEYYEQFCENLCNSDLDPNQVFSKEKFEESVKYFKAAAVCYAMQYAFMMHVDAEFREEMFQDKRKFVKYLVMEPISIVNDQWHIEHYRNVLRGLVEDLLVLISDKTF